MKKKNQIIVLVSEDKAIKAIEKDEGKKCKDYRRDKNRGYDIKIGNKFIEVKARKGKNPTSVDMTKATYEFAKKNKNFWLYYVCDINSKQPKIFRYPQKEVMNKTRPKRHYRFFPNKK